MMMIGLSAPNALAPADAATLFASNAAGLDGGISGIDDLDLVSNQIKGVLAHEGPVLTALTLEVKSAPPIE